MSTEGSGASRARGEGIHNEDAFLVEEGLGLYVVCDGASEAPAGEVASRLACQAVDEGIEARLPGSEAALGPMAVDVVEAALEDALRRIAEAGLGDPEQAGVATTLTLLLTQGRSGVIGHWGDSRAYLIRRDRAHQLTVDHDWTRTGEGVSGEPAPGELEWEVFRFDLEPGDTLVLCTDGAEAEMEDEELVRVASDLSPRVLASRIVSRANRRRPNLVATAVVVRVQGERQPGWLSLSELPHRTAFGHTLPPAGASSSSS